MSEKFTAKQAAELADEKQIPIDEILKNIENYAALVPLYTASTTC